MSRDQVLKYIADRLAGGEDHEAAGVSVKDGRIFVDTPDGLIQLDLAWIDNELRTK